MKRFILYILDKIVSILHKAQMENDQQDTEMNNFKDEYYKKTKNYRNKLREKGIE